MAGSFSRTARVFFNYEAVVPFVLGSLALGVLSNAAFTALTNQFGTGTPDLLLIGGGSLVILAAAVVFVRWWVGREAVAPLPPGKKSPAKHRGLVLLVSNDPVCRKAIEHHTGRLERVWLICSTKSLELANALRRDFPAVAGPEPVVVNDVYDVTEVYAEVKKVYDHLPAGWAAAEVIADFTGMTVPASVGMVLACVPVDRPVQYIPAEYDAVLKAVRPREPIEVLFPSGFRAGA